jgi:uncharacterized protein DUF3631
MSRDDSKIVDFPKAEVTPEERARRLKSEVDRLASLPVTEWLFYIESDGVAEKHGISRTVMKQMIEATIKAREKKAREDKAEDRQREQRAEKNQTAARRESKREQDKQRREQERADKEAARKRKAREKEFAAIAKLPRLAHEAHLAKLAKRLGEDIDFLRDEFAAFIGPDAETVALEPWDGPVDTQALLNELMARVRRFAVMHDDVATALSLWVMFSWLHEIAVHSPNLIVTSAERDSGKTTLLGVLGFLTPRAYPAVELTGPNVYHVVDRLHPTLIIDEADKLFHRKPDLMHIVNAGWTRGTKIPRMVRGVIHQFDPFCPKIVGMKGLALPDTTASRSIIVKLWPRMPQEKVSDFTFADDNDFVTLRRKAMRWAADNVATLQDACPIMPLGFGNRLAANWRLLFAIADLAGGGLPKQARAVAIKLTQRHCQPSEGIRLLAALRPMLAARENITSAEIVAALTADHDGEWCDFRGRGAITKRGVALLLDRYDIHPAVIHQGRRAERGYRAEWFTEVFARYLPDRSTVREVRRKRRK